MVGIARSSVGRPGRGAEELCDIATQADGEADIEAGKCPFDVLDAVKIAWVVGQDFNRRPVPLERHPVILFEVVDVEVFEELDIHQRAFAELDVGAFVELREGFADVEFRYFELFDQDAFEVAGAFAGLGEDIFQIVLGDLAAADQ